MQKRKKEKPTYAKIWSGGVKSKLESGNLLFRKLMEETSKTKNSKIVLALDFPFQDPKNRDQILTKAESVLEAVYPYICAVKINHHLVLPIGVFDGIQQLIEKVHKKKLQAIMDCKANDIGASNQVIAEYYFAAGFDALIANPFVGWEEGLKPIFDTANNLQRGVILLVYMSHRGAVEGYGQTIFSRETGMKTSQYVHFAKKALEWKADGAVVGATYPQKIVETREILRENVPIYSPGVGAQGGTIELALRAGARYLIVGREITSASDPAEKAKKIKMLANQFR